MARFRVWECKIVVADTARIPDGFDFPPRRAAMEAVEAGGIEVLSCFSGWGGALTETQKEIVEANHKHVKNGGKYGRSSKKSKRKISQNDFRVTRSVKVGRPYVCIS